MTSKEIWHLDGETEHIIERKQDLCVCERECVYEWMVGEGCFKLNANLSKSMPFKLTCLFLPCKLSEGCPADEFLFSTLSLWQILWMPHSIITLEQRLILEMPFFFFHLWQAGVTSDFLGLTVECFLLMSLTLNPFPHLSGSDQQRLVSCLWRRLYGAAGNVYCSVKDWWGVGASSWGLSCNLKAKLRRKFSDCLVMFEELLKS